MSDELIKRLRFLLQIRVEDNITDQEILKMTNGTLLQASAKLHISSRDFRKAIIDSYLDLGKAIIRMIKPLRKAIIRMIKPDINEKDIIE